MRCAAQRISRCGSPAAELRRRQQPPAAAMELSVALNKRGYLPGEVVKLLVKVGAGGSCLLV